jgi:UDP:flavonoid glycosyltransferase YjiC (YdhE family)
LVSIGTRGDAQPFVVLADELVRRGHEVVLGLSPDLVEFAGRAGLHAEPVGPSPRDFMDTDEGRALLTSRNAWQMVDRMSRYLNLSAAMRFAQTRALCEGADAIVASPLSEDSAVCVAEAARIPFAGLHVHPWRRTRAYPVFAITTRQLPPAVNLATWWLFERMWWRGQRTEVNRLRAEVGLAPTRRSTWARMAAAGAPAIQAYHRAVVPGLVDYGAQTPVVGFLTPSADLRAQFGDAGVNAELEAWLDASDPPVYFGFGSIPVLDPAATLAMIRTVADRCGVRAIVSAGWSRLEADASDERIRVIGSVDLAALLPRCRAAVHHGGAGTTATGVIAGVPAVVCSNPFGDQPFWGKRLERLGVGKHMPLADMDAATLTTALQQVLDPAYASRARHLAEIVGADADAAARTADYLEQLWTRTGDRRVAPAGRAVPA